MSSAVNLSEKVRCLDQQIQRLEQQLKEQTQLVRESDGHNTKLNAKVHRLEVQQKEDRKITQESQQELQKTIDELCEEIFKIKKDNYQKNEELQELACIGRIDRLIPQRGDHPVFGPIVRGLNSLFDDGRVHFFNLANTSSPSNQDLKEYCRKNPDTSVSYEVAIENALIDLLKLKTENLGFSPDEYPFINPTSEEFKDCKGLEDRLNVIRMVANQTIEKYTSRRNVTRVGAIAEPVVNSLPILIGRAAIEVFKSQRSAINLKGLLIKFLESVKQPSPTAPLVPTKPIAQGSVTPWSLGVEDFAVVSK